MDSITTQLQERRVGVVRVENETRLHFVVVDAGGGFADFITEETESKEKWFFSDNLFRAHDLPKIVVGTTFWKVDAVEYDAQGNGTEHTHCILEE